MERFASSQWRGNLKQGTGFITSESGVLSKLPYSFLKRFGEEPGTNPEELIASAHSACFAMAMSGELEKMNLKAETIDAKSVVTLERAGDSWGIPRIKLDVTASVPGATFEQVEQAAQTAKANCPISKLLRAEITLNFNLSSEERSAVH
jgi:osmotically inducible protein OsmC